MATKVEILVAFLLICAERTFFNKNTICVQKYTKTAQNKLFQSYFNIQKHEKCTI